MHVLITNSRTGDTQWLRMNERVVFGSSLRSQAVVDDPAMAAEHFRLGVLQDRCQVESIDDAKIQVNGETVATARVIDGDEILAGGTAFRVSIESADEERREDKASDEPRYAYARKQCSTGITLYAADADLNRVEDLLDELARERRLFVLINEKSAGDQVALDLDPDFDLFRSAPEDIRSEFSLFLREFDSVERLIEIYDPLRGLNCATIIAASKNIDQVREDLKYHYAWFSRPNSLRFHLEHGSKELAAKLVAPAEAIFADAGDMTGWWLASDGEKDWRDLGLTVAPLE